jgi:hypothetical protein
MENIPEKVKILVNLDWFKLKTATSTIDKLDTTLPSKNELKLLYITKRRVNLGIVENKKNIGQLIPSITANENKWPGNNPNLESHNNCSIITDTVTIHIWVVFTPVIKIKDNVPIIVPIKNKTIGE